MNSTVKRYKPHWSELPPTWRYVIGTAMQAGELVLKLGCVGAIATSVWVMVDQETNETWGARFRKVSAVAEAVAGFYDDDFKVSISKGDVSRATPSTRALVYGCTLSTRRCGCTRVLICRRRRGWRSMRSATRAIGCRCAAGVTRRGMARWRI